MALLLREGMNFFIVRTRGTEKEWIKSKKINEAILDDAKVEMPNMTNKIQKNIDGMPLRSFEWTNVCEAWSKLSYYFTEQYLEEYEKNNFGKGLGRK